MATYRKYSKEFKLQAARLVTEQGYSYKQAAKKLGTTGWSIRRSKDNTTSVFRLKIGVTDNSSRKLKSLKKFFQNGQKSPCARYPFALS